MGANALLCHLCAEKVTASYDELINEYRGAVSGLSRQLPPDAQSDLFHFLLDRLQQMLTIPEKNENVCAPGAACEKLHEFGHLMARRGYSIEDVLERFSILQDVLWNFVSASLDGGAVCPADGNGALINLFREHLGCRYKIVLFFNEITSSIAHAYVEEFEKIVLEKEEQLQRKELEISEDIMKSLLPGAFPQVPGLDIAGRIVAAKAIGGDFWDISHPEKGGAEFFLSDVMGSGVPAALLVSMVKYLLRASRAHSSSLKKIVTILNRAVTKDTPEDFFITLLYGRIHMRKKKFWYVSAGHPPPILLRAGRAREMAGTDVPLGITRDATFKVRRLSVRNDDIFIFVSDGIVDSRNEKGEFFGFKGLREAVESIRPSSTAGEICNFIVDRTLAFCGTKKTHDDITAVVLKVNDLDAPEF